MVIDLHMMSQQASKNARMINTLQLIHIDIMVCSMKTPRELRLCELVGRGGKLSHVRVEHEIMC